MALFFSFNKEKTLKAAEKYVLYGKIEAAIKEYEKVAEVEPNDLNLLVTLGGLYAQVKRNKDAVMKYLKVAEHYRKLGQIPQATALYRKINRLDPHDYGIAMILADLAVKQGNMTDALQYYVNAANACRHNGQYFNAVKVLREAVKLCPDNLYLKMELAEALFTMDMVDEAHELFISVGREFYRKGQPADGLHAFQKALLVRPGSKPALKALTDFSIQQGDIAGAVRMLGELVENSPADVDLIVLYGRTCLNGKMYEEAEGAFVRLLDLDPSRYEYLLETARGYVATGRCNRAVAVIDRCTDFIIARRHKKKATAILKEVVKLDPKNVRALEKLADIYERVGERRNLTTTLNTIVDLALEQNLNHHARMALEKLVRLTPKRKTYRIRLANLPAQSGREVAAVELDENALNIDPTSVSADYSTEILEHMVARNPEVAFARLKLLEELVAQQPEHIETRLQLKQRYLESGLNLEAAAECLEIAWLHQVRGNLEAAEEVRREAFELDPSLLNPPTEETKPVSEEITGASEATLMDNLPPADVSASEALFSHGEKKRAEFHEFHVSANPFLPPSDPLALQTFESPWSPEFNADDMQHSMEFDALVTDALSGTTDTVPDTVADFRGAVFSDPLSETIPDTLPDEQHMETPDILPPPAAESEPLYSPFTTGRLVMTSEMRHLAREWEVRPEDSASFEAPRPPAVKPDVSPSPFTTGRLMVTPEMREAVREWTVKTEDSTSVEPAAVKEKMAEMILSSESTFEIPGLDKPVTGPLPRVEPAFEVPSSAPNGEAELTGKLAELISLKEFRVRLEREWRRTMGAEPLAVIKIKVDKFGDRDGIDDPNLRNSYLNPIAELLEAELRGAGDSFAYCGSAEFLALVPHASGQTVSELAERLRGVVETLYFPHPTTGEWVTISVGTVLSRPFESDHAGLVKAAGLALRQAEGEGGNRVVSG